jgi:Zinc carboxypeptidase
MKRRHLAGLLVILFIVLTCSFAADAQIRTAKDPDIEKYLKDHTKRVKDQERAERAARKNDPYKRLRPYKTLGEINGEMDNAAKTYPDLVSISEYGKSVDGRPLRMLKISTGGEGKASILYSANIHGGEMAGNMICLELIKYFSEGYGNDRDITHLLDRIDVYIIPVLNPDGMARTVHQQSKYGTLFTLTRKNSNNIDLNRNFPYPAEVSERLNDIAGSSKKISPNYRGVTPLSEPETQAIDRLFDERRFTVHCNWHTTGGLIMSPPATFPEPLADDGLHEQMRKDYQSAMFDQYAEHTELEFYPTIGSLDDYIYHRYGSLCITMEVGKHVMKRFFFAFHNGTYSPMFWAANVHYIDREVANNMPGAVSLAWWTLKIGEDPSIKKWGPTDNLWVGERPR